MPKRGLGKGAKIGIGVVGGLLILGVVSALTNGSNTTTASSGSAEPSAGTTRTDSTATSAAAAGDGQTSPSASDTPTPVPSPSPATIKPVTYTGHGSKILKIKKPVTGPMLVTTTIKGPFDNDTVYALDSQLQEGDLLVNTLGSYRGTTILDLTGDQETSLLKVDINGSWTITLKPLSAARTVTTAISGTTDDVLYYPSSSPAIMTFRSLSGDSNVTAYYYSADNSGDLLINDIGKFEAQAAMTAGPGVIVISSDGKWTINLAAA